jgi:hypothetical protein
VVKKTSNYSKSKTKTPQIIPASPGETITAIRIGYFFSIRFLMHWKTVLSTAVLGRSQGPSTPHGGRTGVLVRRIEVQGTFSPRAYRCALDPSYSSSKAPYFDAWKNYLFPTLIFFEFRIFHFFWFRSWEDQEIMWEFTLTFRARQKCKVRYI